MFNWLNKKAKIAKKGDIVVKDISQSTVIVQTGDTHIHPQEKTEEIVPPDLYHLPKPTTALIGRKTELAQLTEAIKNPNKRLAIIVAAGGIGKSALTDEWLQQIGKENYYGKTRVFGWSFYAQGSHNTFTNSQPFFSAVLPFLGITEIPKDEIEKAHVLAKCLQQQPCLLILDGLEPLQYSENLQSMNGELQDSALKEFIACFQREAGKSFVLFSSRQSLVEVTEKNRWHKENYLELNLRTLLHEDGANLLQALGVNGKAAERQAISQDLNGHALSLVLMGHLLVEHHQGDCCYAKELPPLTSAHGDSDAEKDSLHALQVLDYYDSLQDAASRCFLQLLGLFDRPMKSAEKAVLIANANHAEPLRALTEKQWQVVEQRLEKSGLLLGKKGTFGRLEWDIHPIIRTYFGGKFKGNYPDAFKQGHLVLFDYFQSVPKQPRPDTLYELEPLYRAVLHGCLAGEYKKARKDVFRERIRRVKGAYSILRLGAYSQDLVALSAFFPHGWVQQSVSTDLDEAEQAWLLGTASYCLMSLGRLEQAIAPREENIKLYAKIKSWDYATLSARNFSELLMFLGDLKKAEETAQRATEYALNAKELERMKSDCSLATVLHCLGQFEQVQQKFAGAEILRKQLEPDYLYLTSIRGAQYCALLLDIASNCSDLKQILERGRYGLEISQHKEWLEDMALNHLTLARTYQALQEIEAAHTEFNLAIKGIQKANKILITPPFYLYRADFYLTQNQLNLALADLNSAEEIIKRCEMNLYQVDYLLIHGRYSLATADFDTALNHYEEAKQLIEETGYHLRDVELDLFAAQICHRTNQDLDSKNADYYLQKAKNRIAEIGQWGLMRVIERDFPQST